MSFRDIAERLLASVEPAPSEEPKPTIDRGAAWVAEYRGERYAKCRLHNYIVYDLKQKPMYERIDQYFKAIMQHSIEGRGLVLYGRSGTGKDHLLAAAMRLAILAGYTLRWSSGVELQSRLRSFISSRDPTNNEDTLAHSLIDRDILAISDPIGPSTEGRAFYLEWLFRVVDERYSKCRPTWVTINALTSSEMEKMLTPQITRRLLEGSMALAFDWEKWKGTA